MLVSFILTGRAFGAVCDGGWPQDNPRGFEAVQGAPCRRKGKGYQYLVRMRADDARDLADYLWGVAEVWACMTTEERGSDRPAPLYEAVARIEGALKALP